MQQSLRASLAASPSVVVVASLGDGLSALNYAAAHKPGLLVIDCSLLDDEVDALLTGVKDLQLATRCLVLTRSHRQGNAGGRLRCLTPCSRATAHFRNYRLCWHK